MTREARSPRRRKNPGPVRRDSIPHSSWTQRDPAPDPAPRLGAEDFWARLGL